MQIYARCPDVLTDKLHPRFDRNILNKKVRLIRRCLRYLDFYNIVFRNGEDVIERSEQ